MCVHLVRTLSPPREGCAVPDGCLRSVGASFTSAGEGGGIRTVLIVEIFLQASTSGEMLACEAQALVSESALVSDSFFSRGGRRERARTRTEHNSATQRRPAQEQPVETRARTDDCVGAVRDCVGAVQRATRPHREV